MSAESQSTPPQWQAFLRDLESQGVTFAAVQFADEYARADVIASCSSLSAIDRAVVSSTWAKLAKQQQQQQPTSSASPQGSSMFGGPSGAIPMGSLDASPIASGSYAFGSPARATGSSYGIGSDPSSLRAALTRGDSTAALPLASEMLQHDPAALTAVLHEFLPHMTTEQIKGILGLGTGDASPDRAAGAV